MDFQVNAPLKPNKEGRAKRYINKPSKIKAFRSSVTAWLTGHYRKLQGKLNMEQQHTGEGIAKCSPFLYGK